MNTLLMVAIVLITLALVAQAGVLIGMYMMSRRVTGKVEALMADSGRLMAPLESITSNLKTVADDLAEAGKIARVQALHIQEFVKETEDTIRHDMDDIRTRVLCTVDEASDIVMRPIRHCSAIASGIAVGIRTFFRGKRIALKEERPAA